VAEEATILPVTPVAHPRNSVVIGGLYIFSMDHTLKSLYGAMYFFFFFLHYEYKMSVVHCESMYIVCQKDVVYKIENPTHTPILVNLFF
jgi:hypothetical protein